MNVKFLNEYAKLPTKGSAYAAGYDLYAAIEEPMAIFPGATVPVSLGEALKASEEASTCGSERASTEASGEGAFETSEEDAIGASEE